MTARNPLERDGTSQRQRGLSALAPSFAPVDERERPALLLYLTKLAKLLRYYGPNDVPDGDFSTFVRADASSLVARLGAVDPAQDAEDFRVARAAADPTSPHFSQALAALVALVLAQAEAFDEGLADAPDGSAVRSELERTIATVLADALGDVLRVGRRVHALDAAFPSPNPLVPRGPWGDVDVSGDASLFPAGNLADTAERARAVALVASAHGRFVEASKRLKAEAATLFDDTLANIHGHAPQMALVLATLDLFGRAQGTLNGLTGRHLDFYLREVLRLVPRPAEPDHAHVLFELAKRPGAHAIPAGTRLVAGKDATKRDVLFATDVELAANHARLDPRGIKTVFVDRRAGRVRGVYEADVANSSDGLGAPFTVPEPRWPLFGDATLAPATLGFALASPMLWLSSGTRTVKLTFHASNSAFLDGASVGNVKQELEANLRGSVSGPKGWLTGELSVQIVKAGVNSRLELTLTFEPGAPGFVAPNAKTHGATYASSVPVMRFLLAAPGLPAAWAGVTEIDDYSPAATSYAKDARVRYENGFFVAKVAISPNVAPDPEDDGSGPWQRMDSHPYRYLEKLVATRFELDVTVDKTTNVSLENDLGPLNASKPFAPWGSRPEQGSQFIVSCPEALHQPLTSLSVTLTWKGVDATLNLHDYYAGYAGQPASNADFTTSAQVLSNGAWKSEAATDTQPLYDATHPSEATFVFPYALVELPASGELVAPPVPAKYSPSAREGFLRLVLDHGFLSDAYSAAVLNYAVTKTGNAPKAPFFPQVSAVALSFTANTTVAYATRAALESRLHRLLRIGPFGYDEIALGAAETVLVTGVESAVTPVPRFEHETRDGTKSDAEGTLYLGFTAFAPPAELSLLFQFAEGSEDPNVAAPEVSWAYRRDDGWQPFSLADVIADSTHSLVASGILQVAVPRDATDQLSVLPNGLHWLRATVSQGTRAVPGALGVHPQAVLASFEDHDNDPARLSVPLPSGSITKLERRDPMVKSVTQPYASFGGRREESDAAPEAGTAASSSGFYVRVAERLRHKRRAIGVFDYERLVLERFPDVYKVRAINHTESSLVSASPCGREHAPGHVHVIVVPNLRNKNAVDPLRPRLALARLTAIGDYLRPLASDFAAIEVTNPDYEEVRVTFAVRFKSGFDVGLYTTELGQDIVSFLSPWLYDDAVDLSFGGRIHRSSILRFVDERPYVDFVSDFVMDQIVGSTVLADVEVAEATRASAVLVSAAAHVISEATTACDERPDAGVTTPVGPKDPYAGEPKPSRARYLGNREHEEFHDLTNVTSNCQVGAITKPHRVWFDTVQAALAKGFDYCAYCFPPGWSRR